MITNDAGLDIIKRQETLQLKAYKCPAGIWTIGYGHTEGVKQGQVITEHQADVLLQHDLGIAEAAVTELAPATLNENQFSALVSFTFNLGKPNLAKSTLLKRLKAGQLHTAANEFLKWNKAKDPKTGQLVVLPGLVKRRAEERELFLRPLVNA